MKTRREVVTRYRHIGRVGNKASSIHDTNFFPSNHCFELWKISQHLANISSHFIVKQKKRLTSAISFPLSPQPT